MTVWPMSVAPCETVVTVALLVLSTGYSVQCDAVAESGATAAASAVLAPREVIFSALEEPNFNAERDRASNDEAVYGPPPAGAPAGQTMV